MAATYTVKQVADILGYSTNSIYTFLKEKRIKGIRVGTGRFRIPQTELNRLLLISKGQATNGKQTGNSVPMTGTLMAPDSGIITPHEGAPPFFLSIFGRAHLVSANIFDWFIGVGAIISGVALFLFNQTFDVLHIQSVMPMIQAIRILLVGGGIGILLTNFTHGAHKTWHGVFHGVLAVGFTALTIFLAMTRDIDAVGIYGTLTVVIALTIFVRLGRILPFVLYLTLLAAVAPIVAFAAPTDSHVAALVNALNVTPVVMAIGLSCLSFGFIILLWLGMYRNKVLFLVCSYAAAGVYFFLGYLFAQNQFWSCAFYFMIIALTCMYLPSWRDLSMSGNKKAHTLAIGMLGALTAVILIGIMVIYVCQLNVVAIVNREDAQKVDFARTAMETDIGSVKSTVTTASTNPTLIAAVSEKNMTSLTDLSRIIFDSSDSIRRIVFIDKNGTGIFMYPFGTFDQTDLSFRDYFIQSRDTGKLYVSDIFEALADKSHQKVVTISAPLLTADKQFSGVLAASLDLTAISARLQKIAAADRGEYVVVLDSHGKRIIHPTPSLIGTDTEPNDPALLGLQGKTGVAQGETYDGIYSMIAYTGIDSSLHWAIALKAPFNKIYALSNTANIIVAGFIIGCIVVSALIFQFNYVFKFKSDRGGGSP
ncbi:MAG: DNA-binding protein [Candidatus Gottesmanbacteria bacterium]|nr:DNA-binding protein [Candidatus Gottesmanbacteria bacterium]